MGQPDIFMTDRRRHTRNRMFRFIYDMGVPVSRQQLATSMGFSLPTVHQNIAELLAEGVIQPGEIQKSTGGRPAVGYTVNEKIRFSAGVAVSASFLRLLIMDIRQNEVIYRCVPYEAKDGWEIGGQIAEELEILLDECGAGRERLLGVGITFPGVIDREKDTIVLSPTLKMKNISLSDLRKAIPYPVFIENDSTSGGAAEWLGLPLDEREGDFVYLFLENGIGGAVFIDGKPYTGRERRSAEFGHMCLVPDGRLCNCGKRGCLEAYCSAFRFTRDLGITPDEFFEELMQGNSEYTELWNEVLRYLSIAVNNLRMSFDCNIILGGYVSRYLEPYLPELKQMVSERNPFGTDSEFLKLGKYPAKAGMMGAAWHFIERYIEEI